jgi:hypothetical protein
MVISINFFVPAQPELSGLILALCMTAMLWLPSITRKPVITILDPAALAWAGKVLRQPAPPPLP